MWHGFRWMGVAAATVALATTSPVGAQSTNLDGYALFAAEGLRARGLRVPAGDVGVNAGPLWVTDALDGPDTTVVADLARVGRKSTCLEILAGEVVDPVAGCPAGAPFTGPLVPDVADACGFPSEPPACDPSNPVDVGHDETRTLPPGVYGDLVIAGGGGGKGTVVLAGGDYVFCSIRTSRKSELTFAGPSTVFVEENVTLGTGSITGPTRGSDLTASDLEMFVGGSSVRVSRRAEVTGRLCAPDARLVLTMGSRVAGSFVARLIRADRVTATNEGSVTPTTSTSSTTTTSSSTTTTTTSSSTTTSIAPSTTTTTSTSSTSTTETSTTTTTSTVPGACDPAVGLRATVTVSYDNASGDLNSALVDLVYPVGIGIPGSGMDGSVQSRIVPIAPDILALGNDKDTDINGVDETLTVGIVSLADEPANLGDGIQPGQVFSVQFDCDAGLPPDSSAVGCFVKDAVNAISNPVPGVTCSVVLAPGTPITTTTTELPTTTTSTTTLPTTTSTVATTTTTTSTVGSTTTSSTTTVPSTTSTSTTTSSVTTTTTSTTVAPTTTTSSSSTTTTSSSSSTTSTSSSTTTTSSTSSTSSTSTSSSTTSTSTSSTTSTTLGGPAVCGNGVVEGTEECDDMNDDNNDDCVAGCKDAVCGDGFFYSGVEGCDDRNTVNGDGCSSTCVVEPPVCGNNRIEAGETCDDGNTVNGDACPSNCRIEFCSPTLTRQDTTVTFTKPAGVNVGSIVVFVNYPDAKVSLPGVGNGSTVRARITTLPTGFVHTANDLDYAIREVLSPSLPGNILNGSTLFKASYDLCSGATAPAAGEYTCTVEQVGAPNGSPISPTGFGCSVTIP